MGAWYSTLALGGGAVRKLFEWLRVSRVLDVEEPMVNVPIWATRPHLVAASTA